ncbi:MAG: thiamine phosphate synthase [Opitutales bacterium]
MRPSLHQARFYGILDSGYLSDVAAYEAKARALIDGGADIVELRAKDADEAVLRGLIERVLPLFVEAGIPLTLNDAVALAAEYDGLGAHIGQDDMDVAEARRLLGEDRVLGLSTHSLTQASEAMTQTAHLDYFCVGPVFATATKPEYAAVGLELLSEVAALQPPLPWFAIGGVNRATMDAVQAAGAPRVVVVSDALQAEDTALVVREIRGRFAS